MSVACSATQRHEHAVKLGSSGESGISMRGPNSSTLMKVSAAVSIGLLHVQHRVAIALSSMYEDKDRSRADGMQYLSRYAQKYFTSHLTECRCEPKMSA